MTTYTSPDTGWLQSTTSIEDKWKSRKARGDGISVWSFGGAEDGTFLVYPNKNRRVHHTLRGNAIPADADYSVVQLPVASDGAAIDAMLDELRATVRKESAGRRCAFAVEELDVIDDDEDDVDDADSRVILAVTITPSLSRDERFNLLKRCLVLIASSPSLDVRSRLSVTFR